MKVTRIAYSDRLNSGKYAVLHEQARRLGRVRSEVWQRYGSINGARLTDRQVRDRWLADGAHHRFGVLANAWKETVRDAMADIVVRADQHHTRADESGRLWLAVPGLLPRQMVRIPLNATVIPTGTLRLILRNGRVEVHYQIDAADMKTSAHPCGDRQIGVDKGYTEVLTDSDGEHHGTGLGRLLITESDHRKAKGRARAKLRSIANNAAKRGDRAKAARIARNNLGTIKRERHRGRWEATVRTETFTAVHRVIDKAATVVAEDLTKSFAGRKRLGKNTNRRLAAWTKGVTAEALRNVSERRGSVLVHVNAAYTSQVDHRTGRFGVRRGEKLHCPDGVVLHADVNAAINVLHRHGDTDITLHTPYRAVKQILQQRPDRHRIRLPIQDSSRTVDGGERNIQLCSTLSTE